MVKIFKEKDSIFVFGHSEDTDICRHLTRVLKSYEKKSTFKLTLIDKIFNKYRLDYNTQEEKEYLISKLKKFCNDFKRNAKILGDIDKF